MKYETNSSTCTGNRNVNVPHSSALVGIHSQKMEIPCKIKSASALINETAPHQYRGLSTRKKADGGRQGAEKERESGAQRRFVLGWWRRRFVKLTPRAYN